MKPRVAQRRDVMEPVREFEMVQLFVDRADVGSGFRRFIVLDRGEHMVRLFSAVQMVAFAMDRAEFDRKHQPARKARRAVVAEIIRRNQALADRANERALEMVVPDGGIFADRALALCSA